MVTSTVLSFIKDNIPLFRVFIIVILLIIIFNLVLGFVRRKLLKKAKKKKQISNIKIFSRLLQIFFVLLVLLVAFFSYIGSWAGLGIVAGLLTAGLGFALQKPITGIAAWIMVVLKRPFEIGDRIAIGEVKGEVYDITLTHIYIDEVGGEIKSDQPSGRNIMIPNHLLFEHNIINYTLTNDYVLGEVVVDVTYESNLNNAIEIAKNSVLKFAKEYLNDTSRKFTVRVKMAASAMTIMARFFAPIKIMQEITSNINKDIYEEIKNSKDVEIAYPHSEIIFKNKKLFKKT